MSLNIFSSGVDTSFTSKLNSNFEYCAEEIYSRDLTASSTTSTSSVTLKSVGVPAGTFSRTLWVDVGFDCKSSIGSSNGSYGFVTLVVNGSTIKTASTGPGFNPNEDHVVGSWSIPFRNITDVALASSVSVVVNGQNTLSAGSTVTGYAECEYLIIRGY